jgi:hypothetical protein
MSPEAARVRQNEVSRAYYEANRAEVLERQRQKRQDPVAGEELRRRERERIATLSPEERERRAQGNRDYYRRNPRSPEKNAEMHFRHRYGLTLAQRTQMAIDQDNLCYLCAESLPEDTRRIHTDHDRSCCPGNRSCGKCIRGLACEGCNTGIGLLGEDPERLRRVADNLEKANASIRTK